VPDRYDDIVLYCAGGVRSILAADALTKMGYTNVKSLKGGIGEWKRDRPVLENHPTFKQ
jgi:rhodanese-related sulfurtransferase